MRLRTLPVSVAGVLMAITWNAVNNNFNAVPAVICLCFAVLAQIASNFANEYFDYKAGRDRPDARDHAAVSPRAKSHPQP